MGTIGSYPDINPLRKLSFTRLSAIAGFTMGWSSRRMAQAASQTMPKQEDENVTGSGNFMRYIDNIAGAWRHLLTDGIYQCHELKAALPHSKHNVEIEPLILTASFARVTRTLPVGHFVL